MKVGLEVHQQLLGSKMFCRCPAELSDEVEGSFVRRLRPAGGEEHTVDRATAFQASRQLTYRYEIVPPSCLVEADEEPPRPLNEEAIDLALTAALLLGCRPVDELQMMRKIVVDGSNTTGFQRTALVAVDGAIEVGGRRHRIESVCLEEDASRKVGGNDGELVYRLDRLGIPLVEVATGPDIESGTQAKEVAQEIGALLRATRKVRRGIGTIREDLNVSIDGGHRVEIKGVQELRLIDEYVRSETERQKLLLDIRDELKGRGARVDSSVVDVTSELAGVASAVVRAALRDGGAVLAVGLFGFAGLLGKRPGTDERLGRELADHARTAGVGGLVHSDELPGLGFTAEDVAKIKERLGLGPADGFALVADRDRERAARACDRVLGRARAAIDGVPGETRDPLPNGRTRYSRPLAGRDRMYPETDVPPVPIDPHRLERLRSELPERPTTTLRRLEKEGGLSSDLARQIVYGGDLERFELLVGNGFPAARVARLLTQELPGATAASPVPFDPSLGILTELLSAERAGRFAKEGLSEVLARLAGGAPTVDLAIAASGLERLEAVELDRIAERIVRANTELLRTRGADAFSPLMGDLMREVRGRKDGKEIAEALRRAIAAQQDAAPGS